ncbi:hypothetical protein [Streptomyces netropsis]|uniref:Uncharacterized protein n=1 Tax=Streptomyces netropsis TaxID=55404 RepID=A0A7W7LHU4_STRNE|nr:hypothetical protein [Streptomyces netropsis]MBB4890454.1 hypothetical protein [Streptomyces netropsis]GGR45820.1 hypothetical protein GCM10010219_59220 [Streptomyces netropsis]
MFTFTQLRARKRHIRLMNVASHLVREAESRLMGEPSRVTAVTAVEVATLAFGRHELRIEEAEATDYLAAALVDRGHSIDHLPAVSA